MQLIGVTPSLESLGGVATQELGSGDALLQGGLGPAGRRGGAIGASAGATVRVAATASVRSVR